MLPYISNPFNTAFLWWKKCGLIVPLLVQEWGYTTRLSESVATLSACLSTWKHAAETAWKSSMNDENMPVKQHEKAAWMMKTFLQIYMMRDFLFFKSLKSREHEVVFRGNIVPCNNTIMWKHNQLCNIVQSFQFMPVESIQNNKHAHSIIIIIRIYYKKNSSLKFVYLACIIPNIMWCYWNNNSITVPKLLLKLLSKWFRPISLKMVKKVWKFGLNHSK